MALPSHIARTLRQHLGDEHGSDLVSWLDEMRAEHRQVLAEMRACEDRLTQRMNERFARVDERLVRLEVAIADTKADLMKWMLVFWVGAVGAIAALAGVLK
jgi:hypothetical protein